MEYEKTQFYKTNAEKTGRVTLEDQKKNNADEKPTYFFFVSSDLNLRLLMSGLMGKQNAENSFLLMTSTAPSSLLTLEVELDNTGKPMVVANFNDQPF
jgi:hypothetical protein